MQKLALTLSAGLAAISWGSQPAALELAATRANEAMRHESHVAADDPFSPTIPDVQVYDQDGRSLRFYSELVKGKTVAINFIFTSCTTICPPLTTAMRAIQRQLADRIGRDIWLISLSVDPTVDRPERLRAFATDFGAGPGWSFITGNQADIDRLLKAFGSYGGDIAAHSTTMLIGNEPAKRWIRTNGLAPMTTNVKLLLDTARGAGAIGVSR